MPCRTAGGEDTNHFVGRLYPIRMNHDYYDDPFNRTDRVPTLLASTDSFHKRDAMRIVEHELCGFEINAMFCLVASVLRLVPLESDHA